MFCFLVLAMLAGPEPGGVRGSVVGADNAPLRKAEVILRSNTRGGNTMIRTTDPSGTFAFDGLEAGNYTITAARNGYVRSPMSPVVVEAGKQNTGLTIKLVPHAVIAGKVRDEEGEPVHHIGVQVLRERWINGRRQLVPMNADSTNDLGEYRIPELAAGRYYLMTNIGRQSWDLTGRNRIDGADMTYAPLFYPGVNDFSQATPITVASGQQLLGIDLQLRKVPTYRIRGKVLDDQGQPASSTSVVVLPADQQFVGGRAMGMVRGAEGAFEIADVQPGSYILVASRQNRGGQGGARMEGQVALQVGSRDVDNIVVHLAKPFDIAGFIKPANKVRVTLEPLHSGARFGASDSRTNDDGTFLISGATPGKYRFAVQNLPAGMYLKSVAVQGQDITAGAQISAAAAGVEVSLGANAPEVTVLVTNADKETIADARVVLVPESSKQDRYWLYRSATSGNDGFAKLSGITPGNYTAYAFTDVEEGSWHSPEFLKTYEGRGVAVKLEEGAKQSVQVIAR